jgi:catechol 2,3-dioxygenase
MKHKEHNALTDTKTFSDQQIATNTQLGSVHLSVTDAERALSFWRDVLGLTVVQSRSLANDQIRLGSAAGQELVVLHPGAVKPFPRGRTGLYHLALAMPNLKELARVVARLSSLRYPHYPTDHIISKSDYLWDPDGNEIEVYKETPEDGSYVFDGNTLIVRDNTGALRSGRDPIDLEWLLGHLEPEHKIDLPIPKGTSMGHVHLYVAELDKTMHFYHDALGFEKVVHAKSLGMCDVTVNGYIPHRIAFNTWAGEGALPAAEGTAGLLHFAIVLPTRSDLVSVVQRLRDHRVELKEESLGFYVKDPSQNQIYLRYKS